jgi:hypothetical protein
MYLTAQRVTKGDENGINAFFFTHGDLQWDAPPHPDHCRGELVDQLLSVTAGGNPVLSFLDIVAPERTPIEKLRELFIHEFPLTAFRTKHPWTATRDNCWFRLALTKPYAGKEWRREAALLLTACDVIYRSGILLLDAKGCGE